MENNVESEKEIIYDDSLDNDTSSLGSLTAK